jgi:hypothetical protein
MSQPPSGSRAPYIIICSGRIAASATNDPVQKLKAISDCATALVSHLAVVHGDQLTFEDTQPISDLQHEIMDGLHEFSKDDAEEKVRDMVRLLYRLENKFEAL